MDQKICRFKLIHCQTHDGEIIVAAKSLHILITVGCIDLGVAETVDSSLVSYLTKWLKDEQTGCPFKIESPRPELLFQAHDEGLALGGTINIVVDKKTPDHVDISLLLGFDSDFHKSYLLIKEEVRKEMEIDVQRMIERFELIVEFYPDSAHPQYAAIKRSFEGSKVTKETLFKTIDNIIQISKDGKKILSVCVSKRS